MRRLGLAFSGQPYSIREIIDAARKAESLGYDSVWIAEDFWTGRDAISVLSCLALSTTRIKLGTCVLSTYMRHPALVAMTINTLGELAAGRLILGLGAGAARTFQALAGEEMRHHPPLRSMRDTVGMVRTLLAGGDVYLDERRFSLTRAADCFSLGAITPAAQDVPIYIGATGPRMTELTGEIADGLIFEIHTRVDEVPARIERIEMGARKAGRDPSAVDITAAIVAAVSDDGTLDDATLCWSAQFVARLSAADVAKLGFDPERVERIRAGIARQDFRGAAQHLTQEMIWAFAAAGTPADCLRVLGEYVAAGVDLPILVPFGGDLNRLLEVGSEYTQSGG